MEMRIAEIKIGKRHRRDVGDLLSLEESINEIGLLHPIAVTPDGELVAGERRIEAFKLLGRETIPATVMDLEKVVLGEYAENTFRKSFTPSEAADIADAIEPIEAAKAKERQAEGQRAGGRKAGRGRNSSVGNSRKANRSPTALDHVGGVVGRDRKTIAKARAIRDAAKENPRSLASSKRIWIAQAVLMARTSA